MPRLAAPREIAMATVVATLFIPGGKSLSRHLLNQVCVLLDIPDPLKSQLPVGAACTYYLLLSTNKPIPGRLRRMSQPLFKLLTKGSDVP